MHKILMIGGTGTISLPITQKLSQDPDNKVYVLNRGLRHQDLASTIHQLQADINDLDQVKKQIEGHQFSVVMDFLTFDATAARRAIELFSNKTKQYIFISTNVVLDHQHQLQINENSKVGNSLSKYGQNKALAEQVFLEAYHKNNFPVTIIRPTQTYSNHRIPLSTKGTSAWSVISRMKRGLPIIVHGDGQSLWASTHTEDFRDAIYPIINNPKTLGEIYQIMNPNPHTWDEVYQTLAELLEVDYKPVYLPSEWLKHSKAYNLSESINGDKRWSNLFDITKLKTINPDFEPKISLREGLQRFLEYMNEHPHLQTEDENYDQWSDRLVDQIADFQQQLQQKSWF